MRERLARGIIRGAGGGGGGTSTTGSTDFSENSTGTGIPAGWTGFIDANLSTEILSGAGGNHGGQLLEMTNGADDRSFLTFDEVPNDQADMELFAIVRYSTFGASFAVPPVIGRVSGSDGNENAYRYGIKEDSEGNQVSAIDYYNDGASEGGPSDPQFAWAVGTWYRVRAQAIGTDLAVKTWQEGNTEPSTYDNTASDSKNADGRAGLTIFNAANVLQVDYFSYSLDPQNDAAPTP